jgi:hypothetical protein
LEVLTTVAVGIGIVFLLVIVARKPSGFLQPEPGKIPSAEPAMDERGSDDSEEKQPEKSKSQKEGWGCSTLLVTFGLEIERLFHFCRFFRKSSP